MWGTGSIFMRDRTITDGAGVRLGAVVEAIEELKRKARDYFKLAPDASTNSLPSEFGEEIVSEDMWAKPMFSWEGERLSCPAILEDNDAVRRARATRGA